MKKKTPKTTSIGYQFHDPRVRDISFRSSQTLLGNEVILLYISNLHHEYSMHDLYMGRVSLTESSSVSITEDVIRRRAELKTHLESGGTLVLFLPPPDSWYVDTGQRTYSGTGKNRQATRIVSESQLLSVLPLSIKTKAAETRDLELRAGDPFASFWQAHAHRFQAAAVLEEPFGETTLVIQGTEIIAGTIAKVAKGLVILLPQDLLSYAVDEDEEDENEGDQEPDPDDVELLDSLFDLIRQLRATSGDYEQPEWSRQYRLPNEDVVAKGVKVASERVSRAQKQLSTAERNLALLEQRKTLFTGSGPALESLVHEALRAIGFDVEEGRPGRTDRIARYKKDVLVLEIKGLKKSAGEKDAAQLEKWVSEYQLDHGVTPKGVLVANAWRETPLADRTKAAFPSQMLPYSEARKHCLITGLQLLGAWLVVEEDPSQASSIARSIIECSGRYLDFGDWHKLLVQERTEPTVEATERVADPGNLAPSESGGELAKGAARG